jgi:hypothetical protein
VGDTITRPDEIDPFSSVMFGGDGQASDWLSMEAWQKGCEEEGTTLAIVTDAEGQEICVAPLPLAEHIAKLLNAAEGE